MLSNRCSCWVTLKNTIDSSPKNVARPWVSTGKRRFLHVTTVLANLLHSGNLRLHVSNMSNARRKQSSSVTRTFTLRQTGGIIRIWVRKSKNPLQSVANGGHSVNKNVASQNDSAEPSNESPLTSGFQSLLLVSNLCQVAGQISQSELQQCRFHSVDCSLQQEIQQDAVQILGD